MTFTMNIDLFLEPIARGNEIIVTHDNGTPYDISLLPALIKHVTDPVALVEHIDAAARNNYESIYLQERLTAITHNSVMAEAIRMGAQKDVQKTCLMIFQQGCDNDKTMREIVGNELYEKVIDHVAKIEITIL